VESVVAVVAGHGLEGPREWLVRPYDSADEDAMHYLLGIAYTRCRSGMRAGAARAGRTVVGPPGEAVARQRAFLAAHRPIWAWLLAEASVALAVDPEAPQIIWAWLVTSGDDVVHAVGAKRSLIAAGLAAEVVRDMLGSRLDRHQVCSLELPQMRTIGSEGIGIDRPRLWSLDPSYLVTRMGAKAA